MNEIDEFLINLQTGITDLYHHVRRTEEICSGEKANLQDQILINDAWLKLENAISSLENLTQKIIEQRAVTGIGCNRDFNKVRLIHKRRT